MRIDVNGTTLWFDVDGPALVPEGREMRARPTMVLLHGGPGSFDHSYFKPDFARLAGEAQVIYLDLRGHGRSASSDPGDWSFEACADDLRAFCDALGIVRPIVLGHSLGGFVAMLHGVRYAGHARALVLLSTFGRFDLERTVASFREIGGDEVAGIVRRFYGGERESVTAEEWARCRRLFGPRVLDDGERERVIVHAELNAPGLELLRRFDVLDRLRAVACPTLVCTGELDPIAPPAAAREIAHALPEACARLEIVEGGGHFGWKDVPDRYWPLLTEFVRTTST